LSLRSARTSPAAAAVAREVSESSRTTKPSSGLFWPLLLQVEFAAFVAAARPHMTGGARAEAVRADRHTTVTFAELMEASGMVPGRKEAAAAAAEEKAGLESGGKLASQRAKELSEQLDALTGHTPEAQAAREAAALAHESAADLALSGMLDAFDDYFHETKMCDSFVSETTPVMIAVLRKAARAIEEELSAAMAALRSGPLIEADCPPAEVEVYLGQLREHLDALREHADEAREHQRLFEAETLNEMEATEAAAWRLWTSRTELWSALARWEAFLQVGCAMDACVTQRHHRDAPQ
jgi:hypothetical protein